MKRKLCLFCVFIMLCSILVCSCDKTESIPESIQEPEAAPRIVYELQNNVYGTNDSTSENLIVTDTQSSIDDNHPENKTFRLNGVDYPLTYKQTYYYPTADLTVHSYSIDVQSSMAGQSPYIQLLDDGTYYRCGYIDIAKIDISLVDDQNTLVDLVEEALAGYVDVSSYTQVTVKQPSIYIIEWYNMIGDWRAPGGVSCAVDQDGNIGSLVVRPSHTTAWEEDSLLTDSEILAIAQERISDSALSQYGDATAVAVTDKRCIVYNGCFSQSCDIEVRYIQEDPYNGKQYNNVATLSYIIPLEDPPTETETNSETE